MAKVRQVMQAVRSTPTIEGAGVHLRRAFGFHEVRRYDPFLLLDDFRSDHPHEYLPGFPWHPHRGIETITYVLEGRVEHGDSMGNSGVIGPGDVQWMTAGSGIIHQEMPKGRDDGVMGGFQLWANLPASHKMMGPRYRGLEAAEIPSVKLEGGAVAKVVAGKAGDVEGPVRDVVTGPTYLDVAVPAEARMDYDVAPGDTVLAYVIEGEGYFDPGRERLLDSQHLIVYGDGDRIEVTTKDAPVRFLLFAGKPLGEPIAWHGPIVMNTEEELRIAFEEYRNGTFIKHT